MTRKEFVVAVTEELSVNPRAVLAGHGIQAVILKEIANRPGVMGKLANFLFMTNNFKKGAKGLKKSEIFKITGYKNFNEFNAKARIDVENFMGNLADLDQAEFSNSNNIITMIILPDTKTDNLESDIANDKSIVTRFDTAVKKENKLGNGYYVTIMFGGSLIRGVEESKAAAKAKANAKKVAVKQASAAKLKAEFVAKAKAKAAKISGATSALKAKAAGLEAGLEQVSVIAAEFGAKSANPRDVIAAINRYTRETKSFLSKLTAAEKVVYTEVLKALKKGDNKGAQAMLKSLGNEKLTEIVNNGNLTDANAKLAVRQTEIKKKIKELDARNLKKLGDLEAATTARAKAQIRFDMKKISAQVEALKAKLGIYKNLTPEAIKNKAQLLKVTNNLIADHIAKGATVQQALSIAIGKIPAEQDVKDQIKEQIMQDIANDTPTQYAVQQALQQVPNAQLQFSDVPELEELPVDEIDEPEFQQALVDAFGTDGVDDVSSLVGSASIKSILDMI